MSSYKTYDKTKLKVTGINESVGLSTKKNDLP